MVFILRDDSKLNSQKGFMSFLILILGIISVVGIALFSLNMQSRETFFLVHYYYLDSARDHLAESIHSEAHDWIKQQMSAVHSEIKNEMLSQFHKYEDFSIDLMDYRFAESIKHSTEIAKFIGFEISAKIHFKDLLPFFGESKSEQYESDGLIYPNPKECRGIFVIELSVSKDGVSQRTYSKWHNFRFVNILPPVVSRFTFFLKNQNEDNGFVGKLNSLPMDLNRDKKTFRKGVIEVERSTVRPLVIINSLKDFDIGGQSHRQIREFDPLNSQENIDEKGWVFLGTDEPNGIILNLAGFNAFNYQDGVRFGNQSTVDSSGKFYYGDYFHRGVTQGFIFTTRSDAEEGGPTYFGGWAEIPHQMPENSGSHFRITIEIENYQSQFKGMLYDKTIDSVFSKPTQKRRFENYFNVADPSVILEQGFTQEKDYRSQHPALVKPYGEYYYSKFPKKFYDSRSPTLLIGPVRRSYLSKTNISQESELHRMAPDYKHPNNVNPKPGNLPIPFFNVEDGGDVPPQHNNNSDLIFDESNRLRVMDSKKESPYFNKIDWSVFPSEVNNLLSDSPEAVVFYRDYLMSLVWFDNYLNSYNSMVNNGGVLNEFLTQNSLHMNDIKSLSSINETVTDDDFFFSDTGEIFNGNRLHLKEYSRDDSNHKRSLFKGKLGSLRLFAEQFNFDSQSGEMNADSFDLRFKATHLTDTVGFNTTMLKIAENGQCELTLNGIVYIRNNSQSEGLEPEPFVLGCDTAELSVRGKGMIIYDYDIHIKSSIRMKEADQFNEQRNVKTDSANPFGLIDIPPLTIISAKGGIKLANGISQIQAYLIALDSEKGTLSWLNGPPDTDVSIIGGLAINHFNLNEINLIENDWLNGTFGSDRITTPKKNLFHRNFSPSADGRLRVVYNNSFLPSLKENVSLHYNFITSNGVSLAE